MTFKALPAAMQDVQGHSQPTSASVGPASPSGPGGHDTIYPTAEERPLAAVAYVLTWLTGLIILAIARKEQRFARWHAVQAIGLGVVAFFGGMALNLVSALLVWNGVFLPVFHTGPLAPLMSFAMLVWLAALVLVVVLAVMSYQGKTLRLPFLAGLADRHA